MKSAWKRLNFADREARLSPPGRARDNRAGLDLGSWSAGSRDAERQETRFQSGGSDF